MIQRRVSGRFPICSAITSEEALRELADMVREARGQKIRLTGYNFRSKKMPVLFEKVGAALHAQGRRNLLTLAVQKHLWRSRRSRAFSRAHCGNHCVYVFGWHFRV